MPLPVYVHERDRSGEASITLPLLTVSATGTVVVSGEATITLPMLTTRIAGFIGAGAQAGGGGSGIIRLGMEEPDLEYEDELIEMAMVALMETGP